MAIFSIEIADEDVERVITSVAANYNYEDHILNDNNELSINPESKYMFANRMVRQFLSDHVKKHELELIKKQLEETINNPTINDPQV
jgi:hypothetical protein